MIIKIIQVMRCMLLAMAFAMASFHGAAIAKSTIGAFDQGRYLSSGDHSSSSWYTPTGDTTNSFFVFDLGALSETVTFGVLRLVLAAYYGVDPQESFTVYGVATDVNALLQDHEAFDPEGQAIYLDLQSGPVFGVGTATPADVGTTLDITWTPDAIAAINASAGGLFAIGIHLDVLDGGTLVFGSNPASQQLALNYTPGIAVNWTAPLGGVFSDGTNWDRGSPPGDEDTATFDLSSTGYTVTLDTNVTHKDLRVNNDVVTLDFGANTYTLNGYDGWAIQLDASGGDVADLTLKNGTLSTTKGVGVGTSESLTFDGVSWNSSSGFGVGSTDSSISSLAVTNGSSVSTVSGAMSGTNGTITVDDSTWINTGDLRMAALSQCLLAIRNIGVVNISGASFIGGTTGTTADVLVSGIGSTLTSTFLSMGGTGFANGPDSTTASLTIEQGGAVTINGNSFLSSHTGSVSMITVDGSVSSFSPTGEFHVGGIGEATLRVSGGGTINAVATFLGSTINTVTGESGNGAVVVTGTNSSLVNTAFISIGSLGSGELTIDQGGMVSNTSANIGRGISDPGVAPDAQGTVLVDGAGSQWVNNGGLAVGSYGSGSLTVRNGGSVFSQGGYIASGAGDGIGTVVVTGTDSVWESDRSCKVGESGIGRLTIENGGTFLIGGNYESLIVGVQGTLSILDGTAIISNTISNSGVFSLGGGEVNTNVTNNGAILVSTSVTSTVNGNLINNGSIKTTDTTFQVNGTFTNNGIYTSDPSTNVFVDVIIGTTGYFVGGLGDIFIITGDFTNSSTQNTLWNTDLATLFIDTPGVHNVTLGSEDYGQYGAADNFNWGTLQLGSGVQLNLLDDNGDGAAIYVGHLDLADGVGQLSSINSAYRIYYNASLESNAYLAGQEFVLAGGGTLTPGTYPLNTARNDGDLNVDGLVNAGDAVLALRILTGEIGLTQEYLERGDVAPLVNGALSSDGQFNLGDYLIIQRMIMGSIF